jgi:hypothetical protein
VWPSGALDESVQVIALPAWIVIDAGEKAKALGSLPTMDTDDEPAALTVDDEARTTVAGAGEDVGSVAAGALGGLTAGCGGAGLGVAAPPAGSPLAVWL